MDLSSSCSICLQELTTAPTTVVREKGLQTLIKKSQELNDNKWREWIHQSEYVFHVNCRKRYAVSSSKLAVKSVHLRSSSTSRESCSTSSLTRHLESTVSAASDSAASSMEPADTFDFKKLCFICGKIWDRTQPGYIVRDNHTKDRVITAAREHINDFGASIILRLQNVQSIVPLKARYHNSCYKKLISPLYKKSLSNINNKDQTFQPIFDYIETSGELKFKLADLRNLISGEDQEIDNRMLFRHLKKKFGNDIFIFQHQGKEPLIYYKYHNIAEICSNWYGDSKSLSETDKRNILKVSAEILQEEVKSIQYNNEIYPRPQEFLNTVASDVPPLLNSFLNNLIINNNSKVDSYHQLSVKIENIAHSIISAIRPKSFISCLQLSVGTYIYRKTGSKLAINLLSKLGVSASYHNIQLHEASIVMHPQTTKIEDAFVQYIFDNTDHNVNTLDGRETFHCLGGIAAYTPASCISYDGTTEKCNKIPAAIVLASQNIIPDVIYDKQSASGLEQIIYESPSSLQLKVREKISSVYTAFLWGKCFAIKELPMWRGFMETLSNKNDDYHVSYIKCLPFINRPPSHYSTLNTALHFAASESRKVLQTTTFVTFDQPLYLKARDIISQYEHQELKNVVVRLGGFHLLMSYLGAVGSIMSESGLEDLWSLAYASESVKKMLSGHAFARAIRAHILSFTALGTIICKTIPEFEKYKDIINSLFTNWNDDPPSMADCNHNDDVKHLQSIFTKQMDILSKNGPTAQLWLQYFQLVIIALEFIEAERLGDWHLHLQSVEKMLPIFHAAGHYPYAKCAHMYLQDMAKLELTMDLEEYEKFTTGGFFTIRRSDKAWAGVWSDMTIEQTLNRYFGTDLKHGRGVTPSVVARYLSTMPSAFDIMTNLENYCGIMSVTSEQHIDLSSGRLQRDEKDLKKLIYWLNEREPFKPRQSLISLSTGIVGGPNIDCHLAFEKGLKGIINMVGKKANKVALSRQFKVKTFAVARKGIMANHNELAAINPLLLFQRISRLLSENTDLMRSSLHYELSPFPLSLFDVDGFMRKGIKSDLYNVFETTCSIPSLLHESCCVIDGGWLLHQIQWPHSKKFEDICELYVSFIKKHFNHPHIVFDGYSDENVAIKTYERFRRREKNFAPDLEIKMDAMVPLSRESFLSNVLNKQKFIEILSLVLNKYCINVSLASGDADRLIIDTAIDLKKNTNESIVVVGNDVDLLVLLVGLTPAEHNIYYYKVGSKKNEDKIYETKSNQKFKNIILFAHAFCGCDTTSSFYNKGKKKIIKILEEDSDLQVMISSFYKRNITETELYAIAEKIIFKMYRTHHSNSTLSTIAELRHHLFKVSVFYNNKEVSLAVLPPTEPALLEHTKRVYYQVQEWLGNKLDAEKWGWKKIFSAIMYPVMTTAPPAPKELLEKVNCSCTNCSTSRCTCKKSGVRCTEICKNCEGVTCENATSMSPEDEDQSCIEEEDNEMEENERDEETGHDPENEAYYEEIDMNDSIRDSEEVMDVDFRNY